MRWAGDDVTIGAWDVLYEGGGGWCNCRHWDREICGEREIM